MLRQQSDYDPDNDYRRRVAAGVTAFVSSKLTATIPRWGGGGGSGGAGGSTGTGTGAGAGVGAGARAAAALLKWQQW